MMKKDIRKGMPPVKLARYEFERRYRSRFVDPAFAPLQRELGAIVAAAWDAYSQGERHPSRARPGRALPIPTMIFPWTGSAPSEFDENVIVLA